MTLRATRREALGCLSSFLLATGALRANDEADSADLLSPWCEGAKVRPVSTKSGRHTIHSYYLANPESPDGKRVLFFASKTPDGHLGDVCMLDRATGKETVLARGVETEDAHRAACQQWICGGKQVAFHDVREGQWLVAVVDVENGTERIIARDRQLAFGQPHAELLPIYGCHWNPGEHRDLELANAATGEIQTVVTADEVSRTHAGWAAEEFAGKPISIFFPVLSPDLTRVFFKIAAAGGGDFRSKAASHRQGTICYDLEKRRLIYFRSKWGHPAWHPNSRQISEMGNLLFDTQDGSLVRIPNLPSLRGCHPSINPAGTLLVQDGLLGDLETAPGEWGIVVGDTRGADYHVLHHFDNSRGARSWRKNHPHPAFSADGRRIYFNVNRGEWTELYVAEAG